MNSKKKCHYSGVNLDHGHLLVGEVKPVVSLEIAHHLLQLLAPLRLVRVRLLVVAFVCAGLLDEVESVLLGHNDASAATVDLVHWVLVQGYLLAQLLSLRVISTSIRVFVLRGLGLL